MIFKANNRRLFQAYLNMADHCRWVSPQPLRLHALLPLLQHCKLLTTLDNYVEELGRWSRLPYNLFNFDSSRL